MLLRCLLFQFKLLKYSWGLPWILPRLFSCFHKLLKKIQICFMDLLKKFYQYKSFFSSLFYDNLQFFFWTNYWFYLHGNLDLLLSLARYLRKTLHIISMNHFNRNHLILLHKESVHHFILLNFIFSIFQSLTRNSIEFLSS